MEEKLKQLFSHVDLIRVYEYLEHSREANISLLQRYANEKEILEEFIKDISSHLGLNIAEKRKFRLILLEIKRLDYKPFYEEIEIEKFNNERKKSLKLPQLEEIAFVNKKIFCLVCNSEISSNEFPNNLEAHVESGIHFRKLKLIRTLSSFYSNDITWFTISSDIDGADRVFCHLCNDVKGRRVTTTISSFTGLHCDKEHKNMFQEWKTKHSDHPFQKKKLVNIKNNSEESSSNQN